MRSRGPRQDLTPQGAEVHGGPVLDQEAIGDAEYVDDFELDVVAARSQPPDLAEAGSAKRLPRADQQSVRSQSSVANLTISGFTITEGRGEDPHAGRPLVWHIQTTVHSTPFLYTSTASGTGTVGIPASRPARTLPCGSELPH